MRIELGHPVEANVVALKDKTVRFVTDDGRTMFEVSCGKDGKSIEVRGVEAYKVKEKLYASTIDVRPNVANSVTIMSRAYDEQ